MTKWIPVSERLPDNNKIVLVYGNWEGGRGITSQALFRGITSEHKPRWYMGDYIQNPVITHWQLLPDPPDNKEQS